MSKTNMIKEYVEDLPGGKELLRGYFSLGHRIVTFIVFLLFSFGFFFINYYIHTYIKEQDLSIQLQESLNELKSLLDNISWLLLILTSLLGLLIIYSYYDELNRADNIFRKAVEKGYTSPLIENSYISNAKVNPDQLKAQKARTSDFLLKLDERFINKEISDQNYKELKAKYEIQLKDIEKQILDAELHE